MTPNKDNIRKWVSALRSGKYIQGAGYLKVRTSDGKIKHCCLGVACELAGNPSGILRGESRNGSTVEVFKFESQDGGEIYRLTCEAQEWLGIYENNPELVINGRETSLAMLNDSDLSFLAIASIIEENWLL